MKSKLPEHWAVEITKDNRIELKTWVESLPNYESNYDVFPIGRYVVSTSFDNSYQIYGTLPHLYTLISYEDFLEEVKDKDEKKQSLEVFTVQGPLSLLRALAEEVGAPLISDSSRDYDVMYPDRVSKYFHGSVLQEDIHFCLPRDWDKAVLYATEYFHKEPIQLTKGITAIPEEGSIVVEGKSYSAREVESILTNINQIGAITGCEVTYLRFNCHTTIPVAKIKEVYDAI